MSFSSIKVKNKYEVFKNKYMNQVGIKAGEQYKTGKLPLKNFIEYIRALNNYSVFVPKEILKDFIKSINPEFESEVYEILKMTYRYSNNDTLLEKIRTSSIFKLVSKDEDKDIESSIIYSEDNFFDRFVDGGKVLEKDDDFDAYTDFDFTNGLNGLEYDIIIKNFLELRKKVFENNPDSKIHISSREVIVDNNGEYEFYHIDEGELIPMKIDKRLDLNFAPEVKVEKNNEQKIYTPPIKVNGFTSFINSIKRKIFEYKNKGAYTPIDYSDDVRSSYWKNRVFKT